MCHKYVSSTRRVRGHSFTLQYIQRIPQKKSIMFKDLRVYDYRKCSCDREGCVSFFRHVASFLTAPPNPPTPRACFCHFVHFVKNLENLIIQAKACLCCHSVYLTLLLTLSSGGLIQSKENSDDSFFYKSC